MHMHGNSILPTKQNPRQLTIEKQNSSFLKHATFTFDDGPLT
jgi:hypothetical protein